MKFKLVEANGQFVKILDNKYFDLSEYSVAQIIEALKEAEIINKSEAADYVISKGQIPLDEEAANVVFQDGTVISAFSHIRLDLSILMGLQKQVPGFDNTDFFDPDIWDAILNKYTMVGYSLCYSFNACLIRSYQSANNSDTYLICLTLPQEGLSNKQYNLIEQYLEDIQKKYGKRYEVTIEIGSVDAGDFGGSTGNADFSKVQSYFLKEYFPEDIIKKIKRFYSSGILYEHNFKEFNPVYKTANDCYLIAFCACFGISYEEAKHSGISSDLRTIKKIFQQKGFKYNQVASSFKDSKMTVEQFAQKHPFGTYYVCTTNNKDGKAGHAVAVIDGTIYDASGHPDYNQYYVDGYFEIKRTSSHLDTSYLDDSNYFSDYAVQYALNKLSVNDMDENTTIKATRSGTNSLTLKIGNRKFDFDFPLNSSKADNEKMIRRAIDKVIR